MTCESRLICLRSVFLVCVIRLFSVELKGMVAFRILSLRDSHQWFGVEYSDILVAYFCRIDLMSVLYLGLDNSVLFMLEVK